MVYIANMAGILAVAVFVLSYQVKKRRGIIFFNAASRVLYVAQYLLLGAYEGALMDLVAFLISVFTQKADAPLIKRHYIAAIVVSNLLIVATGLLLYQNVFSLLPIFGVIFETMALWLKKEKQIRVISFFGAPFWLAYNLTASAYGSAIGNVITMCSIVIAIFRYDILRKDGTEQSSKEECK